MQKVILRIAAPPPALADVLSRTMDDDGIDNDDDGKRGVIIMKATTKLAVLDFFVLLAGWRRWRYVKFRHIFFFKSRT
jgi:hypothetical protein